MRVLARVWLVVIAASLLAVVFARLPTVGATGELEQPLPTYTPYPTQTPYPTYTPFPTPVPSRLAPPPTAADPRPVPGLDPAIQAQANQEINDIYLQISRIQSERAGRRVPLLQLPSTHAAVPAAALMAAPDPGRRVGVDSWYSNQIDLPESMSVSVRVDVYESTRGWGYVLVGVMEYGKREWIRHVNIGPETWREQDWELWVED